MANQLRDSGRGQPPPEPRGGSAGETLAARRDRLSARLEVGWEQIDRVEAAGGDADALTDFWIALLREYERACDRIAAGADGSPVTVRVGDAVEKIEAGERHAFSFGGA